MKVGVIATLAIMIAACSGESKPFYSYQIYQNPGVPEYGLIDRQGPLVVVLASDIDQTLTGRDTTPIAQELADVGFSVVSLDLPSHHPGDEPHALSGWRSRIDAGERGLFTAFCRDLTRVLDDLKATRVSAVGISRGSYLTAICAASDARLNSLALLAPVTDLRRLYEFGGAAVDPNIFGLAQYAPLLMHRNVLIRISRNDDRVGTDAAVAFAESIGAELQLVDTIGHDTAEDGSTVRWLLTHR